MSKVSANRCVQTVYAVVRQQSPRRVIHAESKHCSRSIVATDGCAGSSFPESCINLCGQMVWRADRVVVANTDMPDNPDNMVDVAFYILKTTRNQLRITVASFYLSTKENYAAIAIAADTVHLDDLLPPMLLAYNMGKLQIERGLLRATTRAIRYKLRHLAPFWTCANVQPF